MLLRILRLNKFFGLTLCCALLAACSGGPTRRGEVGNLPTFQIVSLDNAEQAEEIVLFTMGLLETDYKFGGNHPDAGLDCSGMVSYAVEQVSGKHLPHNAEKIARSTRAIEITQLQPGDLVFFNTNGRPYSHMGIYIGEQRFIHAPRTNSQVRIDKLDNGYFAKRLHAAHTLVAN